MIEEGGRESRKKKSEEGKKEKDRKEGEVLSLAFLFLISLLILFFFGCFRASKRDHLFSALTQGWKKGCKRKPLHGWFIFVMP